MVLLTILKKHKKEEKELRILILGLDNSGKTTILKRINGEQIDTISPTLGFNIKTLEYKYWKLNCWDVGGQKSLRTYWRNYFERTDAVIWVVDSADILRLEDCQKELHSLLGEEILRGVSVLILANKADLKGALGVEDIERVLRLQEIKGHHWKTFQTSAFTGENLLESLDWMIEDVSSRVLVFD